MHMKESAYKTKIWNTLRKRFQRWAESWIYAREKRKQQIIPRERKDRMNTMQIDRDGDQYPAQIHEWTINYRTYIGAAQDDTGPE